MHSSRILLSTTTTAKYGRLYLAGFQLSKHMPERERRLLPRSVADPLRSIKIGMVEKDDIPYAKKRLSNMNTGNPFQLELLWSISCEDPSTFETYWQKQFVHKHVRGEWYLLDENDVERVKTTMDRCHRTGIFPDQESLDSVKAAKRKTKKKIPEAVEQAHVEIPLQSGEHKKAVKTILKKYREQLDSDCMYTRRAYLTKEDFQIVLAALRCHEEAEVKIGVGVERIFVAETTKYANFCFHVKRFDGTEEDFSYQYCFNDWQYQPRSTHYTHTELKEGDDNERY